MTENVIGNYTKILTTNQEGKVKYRLKEEMILAKKDNRLNLRGLETRGLVRLPNPGNKEQQTEE